MEKTRVAIKKGNEYGATFEALRMIGDDIRAAVSARDPRVIFLKPNWVNFRSDWLSITKLETIRATIDFFKEIGDFDFLLADAAPDKRFLKQADHSSLMKEYPRLKVDDLSDHPSSPVFTARTIGGEKEVNYYHPPLGSEFLVSLAKMKTHNIFANTLSLKNVAVGCADKAHKIFFHARTKDGSGAENAIYGDVAAMINFNLYCGSRAMYPDLAVIDGVHAMEGNGPVEGSPIDMGLVVASADPLSADIIATELMGFDPGEIPYIDLMRAERNPSISVFGCVVQAITKKFKPNICYSRPVGVMSRLREFAAIYPVPEYRFFVRSGDGPISIAE
ncbi:MAG: DUF362 domain-containing protein [Candidatus Shapirobacteria bacterium]|jgi:uncharacterized protein (DUF362 family)